MCYGADNTMRVLSFNWHEPYLCLLAKTEYQFTIVEPALPNGGRREWDSGMRPLPDNAVLIQSDEIAELLDDGNIDVIICNNVKDLAVVSSWQEIPKILVFHNRLSTEMGLSNNTISKDEYFNSILPHIENVELVFISESKKADWGIDRGRVILPGIDISEYGEYNGNLETILRVGNLIKERDLMMGFSEQTEICANLPTTLLGENPTLNSRLSKSWDDLKNHYQSCRVYLNTTKHPYEDGYNLALLEAMATGMPILSLDNPSSPITDGLDGFISNDIDYLREKADELLKDQEKATLMGQASRDAVAVKFPIEKFVKSWQEVINDTVNGESGKLKDYLEEVSPTEAQTKPVNVWIDYVYYPVTTAHYMKLALEQFGKVTTSGSSITKDIMEHWNLQNMKAEILPQEFPRNMASDASSIYSMIPEEKKPEFFLWVDTGMEGPPTGMERLSIPKVAYLIDTHLNFDHHLQLAKRFDFVFLAQREYITDFNDNGIKNCYWLPLACDPEIHGKQDREKLYDIGFSGSITPAHQRRKKLLEHLGNHGINLSIERLFLKDMAEHFSQSKIIFNNAIKNDLNMRVFEALCSGSMLITDSAEGLSDLFEDKKHLVIYRDFDIVQVARHYLDSDEEREAIAKAGMEEVLAKHTYKHRVEEIIKIVREKKMEPAEFTSTESENYFEHLRSEIADKVPATAKRILEVGCGAGETGRFLKQQETEREVVGIEFDEGAGSKASEVLDDVFVGDIETMELPYKKGYFDCLIFADVLEHLKEPEETLKKLIPLLAHGGTVLMSIPNTQHYSLINQLIEGKWTYGDEGLLDRTHLRFFTLLEIEEMLKRVGLGDYKIDSKMVDNHYRKGTKGTLKIGRWQVDNLDAKEMSRFFAFQYIVTAKPTGWEEKEADSSSPKAFLEILKNSSLFDGEPVDDFTKTGNAIINGDEGVALELLASLDESDEEKIRYTGHMNMALGHFRNGAKIYEAIGDKLNLGHSLFAVGKTDLALEIWRSDQENKISQMLFKQYAKENSDAEKIALSPIEEGNGVSLYPDTSKDKYFDMGLDYITSNHTLENEPDIIGTLQSWGESLKQGGLIGISMTSPDSMLKTVSPATLHRYSKEGFKKIIALIKGYSLISMEDILGGESFVVVLQKGRKKKFNYKKEYRKSLAKKVLAKAIGYWEDRETNACRETIETGLKLDPENRDALTKYGDCLQSMGEMQKAEEQYLFVLKHSEHEGARIGLGTLYLSTSEFDLAKENFQKALQINQDNDRALCGQGIAMYHSGEQKEGFGLCRNALVINPENIPAITAILKSAYELDRLDASEEALTNYLELHPANIDMLFGLAGLYFNQERFDEAKEILERILALDPKNENGLSMMEKVDGEKTPR